MQGALARQGQEIMQLLAASKVYFVRPLAILLVFELSHIHNGTCNSYRPRSIPSNMDLTRLFWNTGDGSSTTFPPEYDDITSLYVISLMLV